MNLREQQARASLKLVGFSVNDPMYESALMAILTSMQWMASYCADNLPNDMGRPIQQQHEHKMRNLGLQQ